MSYLNDDERAEGGPASQPRSRRAVLGGLVGGAVGLIASAVPGVPGGLRSVDAADGDPLILGTFNNTSSSTTVVQSTTPNITILSGFSGTNEGNGIGVAGESYGVHGRGVRGSAPSGRALEGISLTGRGVHGESDSGWGVYGRSDTSHGVHGVGPAAGAVGVYGESSRGVALEGKTLTGYALQTTGRLRIGKVSGVARIAAGKRSVTVTPGVDITSESFVLLTPKVNIGSRGLWFSTNATADTITIHISSARSSATRVAWLLLG